MGKLKKMEQEIREASLGDTSLTNDQKVLLESAKVLLGLSDLLCGIVSEQGEEELLRYSRQGKILHCRSGQLAITLLAMLKRMPKDAKIKVVDRTDPKFKRTFKNKDECLRWLHDGLAGTEGAEQEHFSNMLVELNGGATTLHYN